MASFACADALVRALMHLHAPCVEAQAHPATCSRSSLAHACLSPTAQEESAKMGALRRAYQRALLVPTQQDEAVWRQYEGFEMGGSNKQLARRLLDEWRPKYHAGVCAGGGGAGVCHRVACGGATVAVAGCGPLGVLLWMLE